MGGIKNIYQHYGANPFNPVKSNDPVGRSIEMQTRAIPIYCALCGGEIIDAAQDSSGHKVDAQWEKQYQLHFRCYNKQRQGV